MKKLFYAMALILLVQVVNAQTWGIKGGLSLSNISLSGSEWPYSSSMLTGFHIGPVADFVLKDKLHFNTGLLYSLRGFKGKGDAESGMDWTDKINYLELPLNLAYKFPMNDKSDFFVQAGPWLAYALSGKETYMGDTFTIEWTDYYKRLDFGVGVGAGVQFGSILAGVTYQLGLTNLNDDPEWTGAKIKSSEIQISVGYMFGKKK